MQYKNIKPHFSGKKPSKRIPKHDPKLIQELIELAKKNRKIKEEWESKHGLCIECNRFCCMNQENDLSKLCCRK